MYYITNIDRLMFDSKILFAYLLLKGPDSVGGKGF